jgi:NAD(P)-dependent dehydrogenase (short-subunit alcohol dehydrogenase family)
MTAGRLSARVCLVTGGAGAGIGSGICRALDDEGAVVVVADRDVERAREVAAALEHDAMAVELDVADDAAVGAAVDAVVGTYGRIDVLVNSAGQGLVRAVADVDPADYDRIMATDLRGVWSCCRAVLPHMVAAGAGSIVNIGSNHSRATIAGFGVYAAAKAGLAGLTRGIAVDYGRAGIRCNVVHPGLVDGPLNRRLLADAYGDAEAWMQRWLAGRQLLPAPIEPIDIGRIVAFLASDDSRALTAAEIVADAGTTAMLVDRDL